MTAKGSRIKAVLVFVFGLAVSFGLFMAAGSVSHVFLRGVARGVPDQASFVVAAAAGLIGLIVTWRKARRAARGY